MGMGLTSRSCRQAANRSSSGFEWFSGSLMNNKHGRCRSRTRAQSRISSLRMPVSGFSTTMTASAASSAVSGSPRRLNEPGVSRSVMEV